MSANSYDYSNRLGVQPISWEDFHGICKGLALAVSAYQPEIILAVGRGGYYPGTLLAHLLQVEIYPVRLSRRVNDIVKFKKPRWLVRPPQAVKGKRVLVVDEICSTGETLRMVKESAAARGAIAVRSAVLYAHTWGAGTPDYTGLVSDSLLLNPWDREVLKDGVFKFNPEYVEALEKQGLRAEPDLLIETPVFEIIKKTKT